MIWEKPIYRFRVPIDEDSDKLKEVIINVTGSAPTFENVKDTMKGVFKKFLNSPEGKSVKSIIDFGAAKLRNTFYFLEKDRKVAAVEFEELCKNSEQAKRIHNKCRAKKGLFEKWIFPYPFISHKNEYDLALLINVIPIMPVFAERLMVLQVLYDKITKDGYILWYAQKEGTFYKDRRLSEKYNCGDGIWTGDNKYFKMFFKYHCVDDVDEMLALSGFKFVKKFSAPGNDVRLYKKTKYNLLLDVVTFDKISENIPSDKTIKDPSSVYLKNVKSTNKIKEVIPNPSCLSIENLYAEALKRIPKGKHKDPKAPETYHRLASLIINRVFRGSLLGMELKRDMDNGLKVIDTVFTNSADKGFFNDLANKFKIKCPYVIVEAKNYSYDPKNPEFDQLAGRLKDNVGKFGIQICREINNYDVVKSRCESYLGDSKYIIVLTDEDLLNLLDLFQDEDIDGINEFMDKKIRPLIFKSKK